MSKNPRMAAGAACCLLALFSGGAAAAGEGACWQAHEVEAARVRDLQVTLMLGALKCRSVNSEISEKYRMFSEKRSAHLNSYTNALKLRFMRQTGIAEGQHAYDDFMTRMANSHSASVQSAGFCDMADTLLTLATNADERELPVLARNFSEWPVGVGDVCEATVAAAPAAPAAEPAIAEVLPEQPAVTAVAAVPAAAVEASAPAADTTQQSAAAALEAAAAALQTAAASLKTQAAAPASAAPKDAMPEATPAVVAVAKPVG